jgi:DtxR family transcriptional regulator, Mn-dependent transcriptional regulator
VMGTDSPADRRKRGLKPLEEGRPKEHLAVVSVFERDRGLLEFLDGAGIRPGVNVEVISAGREIELRTNGHRVCLDRPAAARVWVRTT